MTSPQTYAPQALSVLDTISYVKRVTDSILRNNPLTNALISEGLMRWRGHYNNTAGNPIDFVWIGEFFPADTNISPTTPQRGISIVRDDSRGGQTAINLYDPYPAGGGGLKQRLFIGSGDGQRLYDEHRNGGWAWPEVNIAMAALPDNPLTWPVTSSTATAWPLSEGRVSIVGHRIHYRIYCSTDGGATAEFKVAIPVGVGLVSSATHTVGVNTTGFFESSFDVASLRGGTYQIQLLARVTNGVGNARAVALSVRNFSSDPI